MQIVYKKQRKTYLNLPIDMMVSIVIPASGGIRWIHPHQRGADLEVDHHPLSAPIVMIAVPHHALEIIENRYVNTREQCLPFGPSLLFVNDLNFVGFVLIFIFGCLF
jgi:hypothetical protein